MESQMAEPAAGVGSACAGRQGRRSMRQGGFGEGWRRDSARGLEKGIGGHGGCRAEFWGARQAARGKGAMGFRAGGRALCAEARPNGGDILEHAAPGQSRASFGRPGDFRPAQKLRAVGRACPRGGIGGRCGGPFALRPAGGIFGGMAGKLPGGWAGNGAGAPAFWGDGLAGGRDVPEVDAGQRFGGVGSCEGP